jgi:uncharacterized protein (DUF433 family)
MNYDSAMTILARIKIDPAIGDGEPRVGKYSVQTLLEHRRAGQAYEELLAHYKDLFPDDILAAEAYPSAIQYQGSLTLRELVEQVRSCFVETRIPYSTNVETCEWILRDVYKILHATGPQNGHLALPRGDRPWNLLDRPSLLTPDARVYGQFLSLSWYNHDNLLLLQEYVDREELASEIGGGGGICNDYVTCLAVIENGTHLPYRLHYTDRLGERKTFNKLSQEASHEDSWYFDGLYRDVQIEWLDNPQ